MGGIEAFGPSTVAMVAWPAVVRILYLGTPVGALGLLGKVPGIEFGAACISRPRFPGMRRLRRACAEQMTVLFARPDLHAESIRLLLKAARPDALVSFFWDRQIPPEVLALAPLRIGAHPSLLPRHRGPDPYFWTLYRGDPTAGATVFSLTDRLDEGPVLAQSSVEVPPKANALKLAYRLDAICLQLLRQVLATLARGDALSARPQDDLEIEATEAPVPSDDLLEIRWSAKAADIERLVRAAAPEPGAFTEIATTPVDVLDVERTDARETRPLDPGEAVRLSDGSVAVRCADGALKLRRVRLGDGSEHGGGAVAAALGL